MTERINTTDATKDSASFTPAGEFFVQAEFTNAPRANVEVLGRADAAAPWLSLGSFSSATSQPPMGRFAKVPLAMVRMTGNDGAQGTGTVKVWSGE